MIRCPNCGKINDDVNRFCSECGTNLSEAEMYCIPCEKKYQNGEKFCTCCGEKLVSKAHFFLHMKEEKRKQEELEEKRGLEEIKKHRQEQFKICKSCGKKVHQIALDIHKKCPHCGGTSFIPYKNEVINHKITLNVKNSNKNNDYCENCYTDIPQGSEYCPYCGSINIKRKVKY